MTEPAKPNMPVLVDYDRYGWTEPEPELERERTNAYLLSFFERLLAQSRRHQAEKEGC